MEKSIILGGVSYNYKINFKMSYNFLKYRNKLTKGFDFSIADKEVVEEILDMQNKVAQAQKEAETKGEKVNENDLSFVKELSPEALKFLSENATTGSDLFSLKEIINIVSIFTKIQDKEKINEILDKEVEETGYDALIEKLSNAILEVFTFAKETLEQKAINKIELEKVANK